MEAAPDLAAAPAEIFGVEWPIEPVEISEKDSNWPDFDPEWHGIETFKGLV